MDRSQPVAPQRKWKRKRRLQDLEGDSAPTLVSTVQRLSFATPAEQVRAALQNFNFSSATLSSVANLSKNMWDFAQGGERCIAIGRFQSNEYCLRIEDPTKPSCRPSQLFSHLKFTNVQGYSSSLESTRVALTLGRLVASHHAKGQQSRWIIFLDEKKILWVMYEEQSVEESRFREALWDPYDKACDTAFGANFSQKAVLLGPLDQLPLTESEDLRQMPQIFQLDWMIAAAYAEENVDHPPAVTKPPRHDRHRENNEAEEKRSKRPTLSPETITCLIHINTSFIKIPDYNSIIEREGRVESVFVYLHHRHYKGFCKDMDIENKKDGIVVGRTLTDAAWCQVLVKALKSMDSEKEEAKGFREILWRLNSCLFIQVRLNFAPMFIIGPVSMILFHTWQLTHSREMRKTHGHIGIAGKHCIQVLISR